MCLSVCDQLMRRCTVEELVEVVLPRLAPSLSLWQYLSARAAALSSATNTSAAVSAPEVNKSNVNVATMLDEYASLHRSVRSFCDELLRKESHNDQGAAPLLDGDSASGSAVPDDDSREPQVETPADTNIDDLSSHRDVTLFSGTLQNGDLSVLRSNCLADDSKQTDTEGPCNSLVCGIKSQELNDAEAVGCSALDESGNPLTGNYHESSGNNRHRDGVSKSARDSCETRGLVTSVAERCDDVERFDSDLDKDRPEGSGAVNSEATDARPTIVIETAAESHGVDDVLPVTGDSTPPITNPQIPHSDTVGETPGNVVTVTSSALEVSIP